MTKHVVRAVVAAVVLALLVLAPEGGRAAGARKCPPDAVLVGGTCVAVQISAASPTQT